ncbi:MAG: erythromycin esterase family protein [Deltaproteobacteria bacterium]|nr:MAG: erythromycin esterase family protein [Deltaproteobacteria bacterium]
MHRRLLLTLLPLVVLLTACPRSGPASEETAEPAAATAAEAAATANTESPWLRPAISLPAEHDGAALAWLQHRAWPLADGALDALVDHAAGHRAILLGESTHGTQEYYAKRAILTRRLVEQGAIRFVAVEGDWSALAALDRVARGVDDTPVRDVMASFERWPVWMWANEPFAELVDWLRDWNADRPAEEQIRLHGVDVYDAGASGRRILALVVPEAREDLFPCIGRYFGHFRAYAQAVGQAGLDCSEEVAAVQARLADGSLSLIDDADPAEALFNARILAASEHHHRAMATEGGAASWNARAGSFWTTFEALLDHYGDDAAGVFWAHNTHVGDARATDMDNRGEVNIGQLAREALGDRVFVIGFAKRDGAVVAGERWGAIPRVMPVPAPMGGTWDEILAEVDAPQPWAVLFRGDDVPDALRIGRAQRAIGVMFSPAAGGAWVGTRLADRYDALIVYGETTPLDAIPPIR